MLFVVVGFATIRQSYDYDYGVNMWCLSLRPEKRDFENKNSPSITKTEIFCQNEKNTKDAGPIDNARTIPYRNETVY